MRRRTWCPALAVSLSLLALCGCRTAESSLGETAHQGPEGCGTIHLHGAPAQSIAFHIGYVAKPGLLTVPDILRWYPCVARPDGQVVALADGGFDDVDYFSWSPAGDSVVFAAARPDWQIYRSLVNGGPPTSLTPAGHSQSSPAVSPDGTLIAYTESATRDSVWMMENDGSDRRQLTSLADGSRTPVWSPDGRENLAFIRGHQLWLLDVGNGRRRESTGRSPGQSTCLVARRTLDRLRRRRLRSAHRLTSRWPHPPAGARSPANCLRRCVVDPPPASYSRLIAYDTATNITMAAPRGRHQQSRGQGWFSPSWSDAGLSHWPPTAARHRRPRADRPSGRHDHRRKP